MQFIQLSPMVTYGLFFLQVCNSIQSSTLTMTFVFICLNAIVWAEDNFNELERRQQKAFHSLDSLFEQIMVYSFSHDIEFKFIFIHNALLEKCL